jgi:hypothetical protein
MNNAPITLNHFFRFDAQNLPQDRLSGLESSEEIASLRNNLSQKARGISWSVALGDILQGIKELLDVKLEEILAEAWKKTQELSKYRDPGKYRPNETVLVHLVEHTINSEHHPKLEIVVNNLVVEKIEFIIRLALSFKGVVLKIRNGKIREILPGSCHGKGYLAWGKFVLLEEETKSFALPRSINLGEGIPI